MWVGKKAVGVFMVIDALQTFIYRVYIKLIKMLYSNISVYAQLFEEHFQ
jgi:hypothetical protein